MGQKCPKKSSPIDVYFYVLREAVNNYFRVYIVTIHKNMTFKGNDKKFYILKETFRKIQLQFPTVDWQEDLDLFLTCNEKGHG